MAAEVNEWILFLFFFRWMSVRNVMSDSTIIKLLGIHTFCLCLLKARPIAQLIDTHTSFHYRLNGCYTVKWSKAHCSLESLCVQLLLAIFQSFLYIRIYTFQTVRYRLCAIERRKSAIVLRPGKKYFSIYSYKKCSSYRTQLNHRLENANIIIDRQMVIF